MSDWTVSTPERLIRVWGRWIRQSAFDAIEPTPSGMRIHLRGGGVIDIDKPANEDRQDWIDKTAKRMFTKEAE